MSTQKSFLHCSDVVAKMLEGEVFLSDLTNIPIQAQKVIGRGFQIGNIVAR
jgi:hypothetical protein